MDGTLVGRRNVRRCPYLATKDRLQGPGQFHEVGAPVAIVVAVGVVANAVAVRVVPLLWIVWESIEGVAHPITVSVAWQPAVDALLLNRKGQFGRVYRPPDTRMVMLP